MSDNYRLGKWGRVAVLAVTLLSVAVAIYIMVHQMGLQKDLDFGAGAYYYADIPDYEKVDADGRFITHIPKWVYYLLFLAWGYLMYRLWGWISKDKDEK